MVKPDEALEIELTMDLPRRPCKHSEPERKTAKLQ
jgi:hypothetical protein